MLWLWNKFPLSLPFCKCDLGCYTSLDKQQISHKIVNICLAIILSLCFECWKEPSHWDDSFEYPQHMLWLRNKFHLSLRFCKCDLGCYTSLDSASINISHFLLLIFWEGSGSVVECSHWDRGTAGSSLTCVTVLCPWARHINPSFVLVQPRKTSPL